MDFHTLARRDLQALCKKNKIPANIKNVDMADALKSLKIVEGIEEFMRQSQSETAQSSIDSQEMPEVTSPFAPPTAGGRSTRRTNIPKLAPESLNPMTRTRRTARKTQVKDADAIETPAMAPQTSRKKGVLASTQLNMDSQLKECADEGKKDFLVTPAAVTSRRKKAGESTVTRAYSTRRSARLAENISVDISNEVAKGGGDNNELSELTDGDAIKTVEEKSENKDEFEVVSIGKDEFEVVSDQKQDTSIVQDEIEVVSDQKHDSSSVEICDNEEVMQLNEVTKEGENEEINFIDGVDNFNELSGLTDGDANSTVEEKSENKDEFEFVSEEKQETSIVQDEFEIVSDQIHDTSSVGEEIKMESYAEEEICDNEEDMQLNDINEAQDELEVHYTSSVGEQIKMGSYDEEVICDNEEDMQLNETINKVQQNDGSEVICDNEEDMQLNETINKVQQNDGSEIEIIVEKSTEELKFEEVSEEDEAAVAKFVENVILDSGDNFVVDELYFDNIGSHDDENKEELSNDIVDGGSEDVTDLNVTLDKLTELTLQQALTQEADLDFVDHLDIPEIQLNENEPNESEKADVDPLPSLETDFVDHLDIPELQLDKYEPNESEKADSVPLETEMIKIDTLQTESVDEPCADMDVIEKTLPSSFEGSENKPTEVEILKHEGEKGAEIDVIETTLPSSFEGSGNEPTGIEILKPEEVEKGAEICEQNPTMKSGIRFWDNKENIGSGGKLVIMRDVKMAKKSVVKNVGDLDDFSVRKLTKMLKEKLEITKKSNKTEIGNEAVTPRTALKAISENRMVDGAGN